MKKMRKAVLAFLLLLLAAAALSACFSYNSESLPHRLTLQLQGAAELTLEFGTAYTETGALAFYYPAEEEAIPVAVQTTGTVGTDADIYHITYTAQYGGITESAVRTVRIVDTTPPQLVLISDPEDYTLPGTEYQEEGYSAFDLCDGDLTHKVERRAEGDTVIYTVRDAAGNETSVIRTLVFRDPVPPTITLNGPETVRLVAGNIYKEPGYAASDNCDGDLTPQVRVTGSVNPYMAGTYPITYSVTDAFGNTAQVTRTVTVLPVNQPDTVNPQGKVIYLTFDDGPGPYTRQLLEVLDRYNVKATFFVVKSGCEELLPEITQAGHAIGIHTISHNYNKIYVSQEAYFKDLYGMQQIIYDYTGVRTTLMRFPGGSGNMGSKEVCPGIMTQLTKAVTDQGFQYFDWNVTSGDSGSGNTADRVFQNVTNGIKNKKVAIVLQHDTKQFSVEAVERIILWGLENGYSFRKLTPESPGFHQYVNN